MHFRRTLATIAAVFSFAVAPVYTGGSRGQSPAGHHGPTAAAQTHGPSHPTGQGHPSGTTGSTSGKAAHGPAKSDSPKSAPTSTGATPPPSTTPTSPIAEKIASHPQLASRLQTMLPAGMTLNQAALGFKNQGQFIAALHVSQNLGIPFANLKTQMVDKHMSLGQSIQSLKPSANATTATKEAEVETERDLKSTDATTTTTTQGTTTKTKKPSGDRRDEKG